MLYRLEAIRVRLGGEVILDGADFQHNPGERLALVGRNGAGKTTLLRLLAGELVPDGGRVRTQRDLRIARLRQHFEAPPGTTVLAYAMDAFARARRLEEELERVAAELAGRPDDRDLLDRLERLQEAIEASGLWRAEADARALLAAFGLGREDLERDVAELSGGQRTRLALARALLEPADLLLLDEPTNHLDLIAAGALAERLAARPGAALVATHDRDLIDRFATGIVEVSGGRLRRWPAPYRAYREAKAAAESAQLRAWRRQQEHIRKTEEFIRRNIAGQNTRQAQARRKELERLERVERPESADPVPAFVWRDVPRCGEIAVRVEGLAAGYGGVPVLHDVNLVVRRGERVAVVGGNGSGKTTLLRTLAGRLPPLAGRVVLGHRVAAGWYDQELADLPAEGTVVDAIWAVHPRWSPTEVRAWAARFGFPGEAADRPVAGLSGGERGRLALARLLASSPNLLLLDEPTNHLDLPTCEALEDALLAFPGSVVLVSHDRRLVERVAHRIVLLEGGRAREVASLSEALGRAGPRPADRRGCGSAGARRRTPLAEERRRLRRDVERLRREVGELEAEIERRQRAIAEGEAALADRTVWGDPGRLREVQGAIAAARDGLDALEERWAEAAEDLEALEARLAEVEAELDRR